MAGSAQRVQTSRSTKTVRCAIYTRKSTDEGLERDFNTLDAQRGAAEAYIRSQQEEGWIVAPDRYDDGGFSGANIERPALKRLLNDLESKKVDCVVIYKLDRLTRSLADFGKILELLNRCEATFVSVTEQFSSSTSSGRLMMNMLLTFAQFEREMIADRTRDKAHAARRRGKWIGGNLILGYDVTPKGGELVVNRAEAKKVQEIFRLYLELGSLIPVIEELDRRDWRMKAWITREGRTRGGAKFRKNTLHNLLTNVAYTGRILFEGEIYPAEHPAIVADESFNRVQEQLKVNKRHGGKRVRNKHGALLTGLVRCGSCGVAMVHSFTRKKNVVYRYYVCMIAHQRGWNKCETRNVSAPDLEEAVIENLRRLAKTPAMLSEVLKHVGLGRTPGEAITDPGNVQESLTKFDPLWNQLSTTEQSELIRAVIKEVRYDGVTGKVTLGFLTEGIKRLCSV